LTVFFSFALTQTAEGGILSSIVEFFGSPMAKTRVVAVQEEGGQTETNSQNIDLLEPIKTINEATSSPSGEIETTITGGNAVLSETGPLGTIADIKENPAPSDLISVYTVHSGDTLEAIAKMYNVSVNTLRWANDLKKGSTLKAGETLVILPITGIQHIVKKGETIKGLAKKYNGNFEEIVAYNDLNPEKGLTIGETIIIPDGEETTIVSSTKPSTKLPAKYTGPSYSGYYLKPVTNYRRTQGLHGYLRNAIDMAAPVGTPIYASAEGKVIIAKSSGWNSGYGNYIVISHPNGTQTLYAHLSSLKVGVGQRVNKGETIGGMGSTGKSTGSHLHFEVRGAANPF
jgi:murein DD-endopeptidase MepM/ murein hydrolase activator NlpD